MLQVADKNGLNYNPLEHFIHQSFSSNELTVFATKLNTYTRKLNTLEEYPYKFIQNIEDTLGDYIKYYNFTRKVERLVMINEEKQVKNEEKQTSDSDSDSEDSTEVKTTNRSDHSWSSTSQIVATINAAKNGNNDMSPTSQIVTMEGHNHNFLLPSDISKAWTSSQILAMEDY